MPRSWKKVPNNLEIVREAVIRCVGHFRRYGWKTPAALAQLSKFSGNTPRKDRAFFEGHGLPSGITGEERNRTILGIVAARKFLINWLRDAADELEQMNTFEEQTESQRWTRECIDAQLSLFGQSSPSSIA